ncbi:MAG: type II toxin-antitoxin system VapC family toxin [Actinomycetota bacterium]|nr:type II toxin-antitoxin system VapC family toxin [Actinomycetota bacterium]
MRQRVIDASALAYALLGKTSDAAHLRAALATTGCHAPHLVDAELGNVLRKRTRSGDITPMQARTALRVARGVIDYRYPHCGPLAERAWCMRDNLSFYDALYVALATRLDLPLVTGDRRLSNVPDLPCSVEQI